MSLLPPQITIVCSISRRTAYTKYSKPSFRVAWTCYICMWMHKNWKQLRLAGPQLTDPRSLGLSVSACKIKIAWTVLVNSCFWKSDEITLWMFIVNEWMLLLLVLHFSIHILEPVQLEEIRHVQENAWCIMTIVSLARVSQPRPYWHFETDNSYCRTVFSGL